MTASPDRGANVMATVAELIDTYAQGPALLRRAVAGLSREQLLARPLAGKWSTLEVVAHISDFEPVLAERMKRVITHDRPTLLAADENLFAAKLGYHDRDVEEELRLIELTRAQMTRILRSLPADAFARVGVHSEKGERTLEQLVATAGNHIPHHLPFVAEKRKALGA
jgi:hypothetical protein